jgi:hypothetical protein
MKKSATLFSRFLTGVTQNTGSSVRVLLTFLILSFAIVQNTSAQLANPVRIDGNARSYATEWSQAGISHVQDVYDAGNTDDIFAGNEKDFFFASNWFWKLGGAKDKNDIANGAAAIVNSVDTGLSTNGMPSVTAGAPFIVFAGDRISHNGDAQIGFWFFQRGTAPVAVHPVTGVENTFYPEKAYPGTPAGITRGDILVLADFTGGGRNATVIVLEFVGTGGTYPNSDNRFNLITNVAAAVAENNSGTSLVPAGWNFTSKETGSTTTYETNEFYEGYVALGSIFGTVPVCFSRYMLETRSSQSITSVLDDFCGGNLGGVPTVTVGSATVCAGTTANVTAVATGAGTPFTYVWNTSGGIANPGNTPYLSTNAQGNYTVVAVNNTSCASGPAYGSIQHFSNPTVTVSSFSICAGVSGTVTATPSPGGTYTYLWSVPAGVPAPGSTASFSTTTAGAYNVTVTNTFGCKGYGSGNVWVNANPTVTVNNLTLCAGSSGTVTATPSPAGAYGYVWSVPAGMGNPGNTSGFSTSVAGSYNVTITNANTLCLGYGGGTVIVNPNPNPSLTSASICAGTSHTFTVGTPGANATYRWSDGSTGSTLNVSSTGTYCVTVTNSVTQCKGYACATLTVNNNPAPSLTNASICAGTSHTFTIGGTPGPNATYQWSNGSSGSTLNVSTSGTYCVTVTNSLTQCKGYACATLTVYENPNPSLTNASICAGSSHTFTVGNPGANATYQWSNGSSGSTLNVSTSGTYCVTVTNSVTQCKGYACATLTVNDNPAPSLTNASICAGTSHTFTVGTPGPNATYQWSNGSSGSSLNVSTSGTYCVTVTNSLTQCKGYACATLTVNDNPAPTMANATVCAGTFHTFTVGNPGPNAQYQWSNGTTGSTLNTSTAGTYCVTITNSATQCKGYACATLTVNQNLNPSIANASICAGTSHTFNVSNAGANATYQWSNGSTGSTLNVSTSGTYCVTVTNSITQCKGYACATLTVNDNPAPTLANASICAGTSHTFTVGNPGANATYLWSNGSSGSTLNVSTSGTYCVTVTNSATQCKGYACATLTVYDNPAPSLTNASICAGTSHTFTVGNPGANATYQWSNGSTGSTLNVSTSGTYCVTVTNSVTLCKGYACATLTVYDNPAPSVANASICAGSSHTFTVNNAGPNAQYLWSTGAQTSTLNVSTTGTYCVTVTNSVTGCKGYACGSLTVNANPTPTVANITVCAGSSGNLTATPNTSPASYLWSNGATTQTISVSTAGTYCVTVTNSNTQCKGYACGSVYVAPNSTASVSAVAAQCRNLSALNGTVVTYGTNTFSVTGSYNFGVPGAPAWSVINDGGFNVNIVSPNAATTNVEVSGANANGGSVTLRFNVVSNVSCANSTAAVTLTLNPLPAVKPLNGSNFCPNVTTVGSVTLPNSQVGVSYQLKDDGNNNVQAPQNGNGGTLLWIVGPGTYTVQGTFINTNCNSTSGPAEVIENDVPDITVTDKELCPNECVILTASEPGGTWSAISGTPSSAIVNNVSFCANNLAPGEYWVRYTKTNTEGCTDYADAKITVKVCSFALCTYTQGAFGNAGGQDCDGTNTMPTLNIINQSLGNWPGDNIKVGYGANYVQINDVGGAQCVIDKLPGGGPSKEVVGGHNICTLPSTMLQNGRIKNVLLAQTITLALNMGIGSPQQALGDLELQAGTIYTAHSVGGCGDDTPKPRTCSLNAQNQLVVINEYDSRSFSAGLIAAIKKTICNCANPPAGTKATVAGLLALAYEAIGNRDGVAGSERGVSLSEISGGAASINEVFDECRVFIGWNVQPCTPAGSIFNTPRIGAGANGETAAIEKLRVSAFPNPFRDQVKFVIETPVSGQAVLEVYNIAGQKVQTLFNGHMEAGETRMVDYKPSVTVNTMMIYKLRIGEKEVTGKLIGLRQ